MNLGQTMRRGIAWLFVGNAGNQVLNFLFGLALARLLAPEDFGALLTLQIFTGLAGFVSGGGMGQALVRAKEATQGDFDTVFTLQLIIGCIIYATFFFAAPWLSIWYANPLYTDLLRVLALSFIFRPLVNLPSNILYRSMRYKAQTVVSITSLLISNISSVAFAALGYGIWSLVWSGLINSAYKIAVLIPLTGWRPKLSLDFKRGRSIAKYGMLVSVNDIVCYLRAQASIFVLSRSLGASYVGLYNKGESLAKMPHAFITASVYQVLFRSMAAEQADLDKSRYLFFRSIALVAVYTTPLYVGISWIAVPLIRTLYGERWVESAGPLEILPFAWPFWLMGNLSGAVLSAHNWLGRELPVQVVTVLLTLLSVLIVLPFGLEGVAWAIVGVAVYSAFHLYWLATCCLRAPFLGFIAAIRPAAILNLVLASGLFVVNAVIPKSIIDNDLAYITVMAAAGGTLYSGSFLCLPIAALDAERNRWKKTLRLRSP